jgi:hypothetical protein
MIFRGNDGGTPFNALTLDMSDAGTAQFSHDIELVQSNFINFKHQAGGTLRANISANSGDNLIFGLGSSGTERVRMSTSNVKFQSPDGGSRYFFGGTGDSDSAELSLYDSSDNQKVRIGAATDTFFTGGGVVSIGTTSTGGNSILTLSTGSFTHGIKQFCNDGQVSYHVEVGGSTVGSISHSTSSTSYNTSSDYRLKENVITDWDATSRLKQLKPSRFNFKVDKDITVDGFLAHEVSSVVPEAITGEKDAMTKEVLYVDGDEIPEGKKVGDVKTPSEINPQGIDQSKLVPLLTKALQEAISEIDTLKAKVTALESK